MGTFAPELAHHWSDQDEPPRQPARLDDDTALAAQREALAALEERVLAARTVL